VLGCLASSTLSTVTNLVTSSAQSPDLAAREHLDPSSVIDDRSPEAYELESLIYTVMGEEPPAPDDLTNLCRERAAEPKLTKAQLKRLVAGAFEEISRRECQQCGVDYFNLGEYYAVQDEIRDRYGFPLCVGCLEQRMGRQLEPGDFPPDAPANGVSRWLPPRSERLLDRMGRAGA
jgi:hypothetical protein